MFKIHVDDRRLAILRMLRNGFSGEKIAKELGISRQAVWKFVNKLRELGYEIDNKYRVINSPDPSPIDMAIYSKLLGVKEFIFLKETTSTNDIAKENPNSCVVAEMQRKGRGRLGRKWYSEKGGLYFSFSLNGIPLSDVPKITLLTGLAVAKTLNELNPKIKWPNDVLIDNKKVSGILCEFLGEELASRIIIGVGINVKNRIPSDLTEKAVNLSSYGLNNITEIFKRFCMEFKELFKDFLKSWETILDEWKRYSDTIGKLVEIKIGERVYSGIAVGVDVDGSLLVKGERGVEKIFSGECFYININNK